ncbi:complex I assembly factor TIMMDC1, mitochondrial-like isoform X1 [Lates japonicus]|uniref:Complex I assembly factor TIMMDC1, mitochondrial n=1 Tax=Lates japonicus TaxID=270547 RepID=A0AAD3M7Y3_LATJO|nr:complex I assembly factor TIMMDC1, mitochondrial-like isoform X1 [Lates japonicus]
MRIIFLSRSAHNAAIRGFVRYGWRWSWRVAAFVTLFNSVSTGLSVYRDKHTISHYVAAGAVTGGLFRLNLGLRGLVAGTIIGAVLRTPTGALIISMQSLAGESVRDRRRRERREIYELKLAEWTARLQLTDELIGDLNVSCQPEETSKDLQRIQELLSLPQNEGAAQDSGASDSSCLTAGSLLDTEGLHTTVETNRKEISQVLNSSYLRGLNMASFFASSKIIVFVTFTVYTLLGNTITASSVFVTVSLYGTIKLTVTLFFPLAVEKLSETVVSVQRIKVPPAGELRRKKALFLPLEERTQLHHHQDLTCYWDKVNILL